MYYKQPRIKLNLEEYREIEALVNDLGEENLDQVQLKLRAKARQIIQRIENALQRRKANSQESRAGVEEVGTKDLSQTNNKE